MWYAGGRVFLRVCTWGDVGCGMGCFRVVFVLKILFYFSSISFFFVYTFFILSFSFYYFIVCVLPVHHPTFYTPYPFLTFTVYSPHPYSFTIFLFSVLYYRFRSSISPRFLPADHQPSTIDYQLSTIEYRISPIDRQVYDPPSRIFTFTLFILLHF